MGLKTISEKFWFGHTVLEEVMSPINGKIQVWEEFLSGRRLVVSNLTQSGKIVEEVWFRALKDLKAKEIKNILILGLGAGSIAVLAEKLFPEAKILGVEIDSEIVRLGKKYFALERIKNLEIKIHDAILFDYLPAGKASLNNRTKIFDLILVDMYIGDKVPVKAESTEFLSSVKKLLKYQGVVVFNRLYYKEKKEQADSFGKKLQRFFPRIETKQFWVNKLFLCSA